MEDERRNIDRYQGEIEDMFQSGIACCGLLISEAADEVDVLRISMYMDEFEDFHDTMEYHVELALDDTTSVATTRQIIESLKYMAHHVFGDRFPFKRASALRLVEVLEQDVADVLYRRRDDVDESRAAFEGQTVH